MNAKLITTTYDKNERRIEEKDLFSVVDCDRENEIINLYPFVTYQEIEGFGGALTDTAGYVFSLMDEEQKNSFIRSYFGPDDMRYSMVRIPIDSCDFSLEHYEADSDPADTELNQFSLSRIDKYITPLLDSAEKIYGERIPIMLSPWSPPAYMKTTGERDHGGKLKSEYRDVWARYISRYIKEYRDRGYLVSKLTVQNESKAVQEWDSCVYTAEEQAEFIRDYLYPRMRTEGIDDIGIYVWDHNKERVLDWAKVCFEGKTRDCVEGIAFHWYSGDHFDALRIVRDLYPDKKLAMSEACIEFSKFDSEDVLTNARRYAHEIIGDINCGMNLFMDWNVILDEEGGPNHAKNFCDSPYRFDKRSKTLIETPIRGYLWHFSHFIRPGSVRIGVSTYTDEFEVTAVKSGEDIVTVILNRTDEDKPAYIRMGEEVFETHIPAGSISTLTILNPSLG